MSGIQIELGDPLPLYFGMPARASGRFVRAIVRDSLGVEVAGSPFPLTEIPGTAEFRAVGFTPLVVGSFTARYLAFRDALFADRDFRFSPGHDEYVVSLVRATAAVLAIVQADTDDIQTRLPASLVGGRMDSSVGNISVAALIQLGFAVWEEILTGATHNVPTSAGRIVRQLQEVAGLFDEGTAQAGTATTLTLRAGASADDDLFKGAYLGLIAGPASGQARVITAYDGTTKVATVEPAFIGGPPTSATEYVVGGHAGVALIGTQARSLQSAMSQALERVVEDKFVFGGGPPGEPTSIRRRLFQTPTEAGNATIDEDDDVDNEIARYIGTLTYTGTTDDDTIVSATWQQVFPVVP